ncbi:MAG: TonB-dependent receptor [Alphaproteobacteria bacterium]
MKFTKKLAILSFNILSLALLNSANGKETLNYEITAEKLNNSRNNIYQKTHSTSYNFNEEALQNLPLGEATSLNQVLARAPGVTAGSYGQIHVRGDHSNVQYRINDVIIPEGINGFGQVLDVRFADSINLLTGALPAQYGYRTAGVVEIKTKDQVKNSKLDKGAYSELLLGSNNDLGVNQQLSGNINNLNYFLSASYLQNNRGIESPTSARNSTHNDTKQDKVFGYFSKLLNEKNRLSLILANATNRYQIPTTANQAIEHEFSGIQNINSRDNNDNQKEANRFAVLSLQGVNNHGLDYQIAGFVRHSQLDFRADNVGGLTFNGIASNLDRSSINSGLQADFSKELTKNNTARFGFYFSDTRADNSSDNLTFATDENGDKTSIIKINTVNKSNTRLYSLYAQNEFQATKKLAFNFGGRFDQAQGIVNENQFSPRFSALYKLSDKTKIHSGYAKYFTAPKAELVGNRNPNLFVNTTNESENLVSGKLRSEATDYYDFGINHKFNKELTLGLDGYYKNVKNLLDEGQFGNALILTPYNFKKAKIYGLELSSNYKKDNFSAYANLAWQKTRAHKIISGQYLIESEEVDFISRNYVNLDHAQRTTASAGVSYKIAKNIIGSDMLFASGMRRGHASTLSMPAYTVFNVFANREIAKINFRLAINNIFDHKYRLNDGTGIGMNASRYGLRRSYYLIISKNF